MRRVVASDGFVKGRDPCPARICGSTRLERAVLADQNQEGSDSRRSPRIGPRTGRYGWIVIWPLTVLPTACTGPVSGGGTLPVLPVIVSEPVT